MKPPHALTAALLASVAYAASAHVLVAQGPLSPPPGPPAPTMKTIEQIEPRTPISSLPYTITNGGSFYVTGHLIGGTGSSGITISASDVTLDLNGFALLGVPGSVDGITVPTDRKNIDIRNGTIRNWGEFGVNAQYADNSLLTGLRAYSNGWDVAELPGGGDDDGLRVGENSVVAECVAEANERHGIVSGRGTAVNRCSTSGNGTDGINCGSGNTVSGCSASLNGEDGIDGDDDSTIVDCAASENGLTGIRGGSGSTVSGCSASDNGEDGIRGGDGSTVSGCSASGNERDGFGGGNGRTVSGCTASGNSQYGIRVGRDCVAAQNLCEENGAAGIGCEQGDNVIERNLVVDNGIGILVTSDDSGGSLIIRNAASGNSTNYAIVAGNKVGMIVDAPNTTTNITGSTGSVGVGTTDPWANFSF